MSSLQTAHTLIRPTACGITLRQRGAAIKQLFRQTKAHPLITLCSRMSLLMLFLGGTFEDD